MKKLFAALVVLGSLLGGPAAAQGTLSIATTQQFDVNGHPLGSALLYIYVVGTVATPQLAYQDVGLTNPLPWPVPADNNGRLPVFYLAAGSVHARLTDASGNIQFDYPSILVIGAAITIQGGGGGGGGGSVGGTIDPTSIATTGDVKYRLTSESLSGWVKLNGQTIGSAVSGATQLANASAQALFIYLWTNCASPTGGRHCAVSGGLGASALGDFNANKTITLPDMRDRIVVGRDCMESTCANGLLPSNIASGGGDSVDTPLAFGGAPNQVILQANLPNISLTPTLTPDNGTLASPARIVVRTTAGTGPGTIPAGTGDAHGSITVPLGGSGTALPTISPFVLGTYYMKL